MNDTQKQNVLKWIDALRSGIYEQGRTYLCCEGKYCCLGVACEVQNLKKKVETCVNADDTKSVINFYSVKDVSSGGLFSILPNSNWFTEIYGFNLNYTKFNINGKCEYLYTHNDVHNATFNQIADALETQLLDNKRSN